MKCFYLFVTTTEGSRREIKSIDAFTASDAWEIALRDLDYEYLADDERPVLLDGTGKSVPSYMIM